jgi:hypothetical protein
MIAIYRIFPLPTFVVPLVKCTTHRIPIPVLYSFLVADITHEIGQKIAHNGWAKKRSCAFTHDFQGMKKDPVHW